MLVLCAAILSFKAHVYDYMAVIFSLIFVQLRIRDAFLLLSAFGGGTPFRSELTYRLYKLEINRNVKSKFKKVMHKI